jgi:ketosteroid isomerase-like protein
VATPKELTLQYIDAYNRRDDAAMHTLLSPVLEFVLPGPATLRSADEVLAWYHQQWAAASRSRVDVRELMESDDSILAEITMTATMGELRGSVEGVIAHRWQDGRMVRYRAYLDPMPAPAEAVMKAARAG